MTRLPSDHAKQQRNRVRARLIFLRTGCFSHWGHGNAIEMIKLYQAGVLSPLFCFACCRASKFQKFFINLAHLFLFSG